MGPLRWAPSGPKLWDMKANNSAVLAAARRVAAVRAELSEAERWASEGRPGARAMVGALKSDLRVLESRLATM